MILGHGLGRIDHHVQKNLIDLRGHTLHLWQGGQLQNHIGPVFDLAAHNVEGRAKPLVQISHDEVLHRIRARKILQVLNDIFHPGDALLCLAQQVLNVLADGRAQGGRWVRLRFGQQLIDGLFVYGDVLVQGVQVGRDITDRVVDLMGNTGGELAQGGQFFRLVQPARYIVQLVCNHMFAFDQGKISPPQKKPQDDCA